MNSRILRRWLTCLTLTTLLSASTLFSACSTPTPPAPPVDPVVPAYSLFLENEASVDSDSVVALVAYLSSHVSRSRLESWQAYDVLFADYERRVLTDVIDVNYPVVASGEEVEICMAFADRWLRQARTTAAYPMQARSAFVQRAGQLIFRIQDHVYEGRQDPSPREQPEPPDTEDMAQKEAA